MSSSHNPIIYHVIVCMYRAMDAQSKRLSLIKSGAEVRMFTTTIAGPTRINSNHI